jgi:hypothetical protein
MSHPIRNEMRTAQTVLLDSEADVPAYLTRTGIGGIGGEGRRNVSLPAFAAQDQAQRQQRHAHDTRAVHRSRIPHVSPQSET